MKNTVKWISGTDLMKRWKTDNELSVFDAIKNGLPIAERILPGEIRPVKTDEAIKRLQTSGIGTWEDGKSIESLDLGRVFFYLPDVQLYEAESGEVGLDKNMLSCASMLKEPVFESTMAAIKDVLSYYEENQPAKRSEAVKLLEAKYKGKLTDQIFREILKVVPENLKRKKGQRDR